MLSLLFFFVIELLQNHAANCRSKPTLSPYLAVPHVRDALIPLADRQADICIVHILRCVFNCILSQSEKVARA